MRLALIVAMTRDGLMGRDNALPWHWPEDLAHFKRTTRGHAVVMGRRTFESLQQNFGGPLPQRDNLVISRGAAGAGADGEPRDGARWFGALDAALAWLERRPAPAGAAATAAGAAATDGEAFLLGGAEIFRAAFERPATQPARLIVTWVPDVPSRAGDTFFPFRPPEPWILQQHLVERRWRSEDGALEFVVYARKPPETVPPRL